MIQLLRISVKLLRISVKLHVDSPYRNTMYHMHMMCVIRRSYSSYGYSWGSMSIAPTAILCIICVWCVSHGDDTAPTDILCLIVVLWSNWYHWARGCKALKLLRAIVCALAMLALERRKPASVRCSFGAMRLAAARLDFWKREVSGCAITTLASSRVSKVLSWGLKWTRLF